MLLSLLNSGYSNVLQQFRVLKFALYHISDSAVGRLDLGTEGRYNTSESQILLSISSVEADIEWV